MLRKKWINCSNSHLKKGDRDEMRKRESLQRDDELVECKNEWKIKEEKVYNKDKDAKKKKIKYIETARF